MKKELVIPHAVGFCKNCFRKRRPASAYCGQCQGEGERMKVYFDEQSNFPLLEEAKKKFDLDKDQLKTIVFTYGDTIYSQQPLSYGLVAHEVVHVFQQTVMGAKKWWTKYLKDEKFRMQQELEAYQIQYECYEKNKPGKGREMIRHMAGDLSGSMYGDIVSFEDAVKLITAE